MKKILFRVLLFLVFLGLVYLVQFVYNTLPILTGYGAKHLCSCTFISGRAQDDIIRNELGRPPLSFGTFTVNRSDSSATGTVWGMFGQKAIFRKGWGCTLLNGVTEDSLKKIPFPVNAKNVGAAPMKDSLDSDPFELANDSVLRTINHSLLRETVEDAFQEPGSKPLRRTRSVLIIYKGKLIYSKYASGFGPETPQAGWSMAKSITNALVGILVGRGILNVDSPAPIAEWQQDQRKNITIKNLLQGSSGLKWEERYDKSSDATNMLFREKDMGLFTIHSRLAYPPDSVFEYSSGTPNVLSWIIRKKLGEQEYMVFPYLDLFNPVGMLHTTLEPDAGGSFVGSSYCFASAEDWARFGLLYLNDGVWNGNRILPEGWVKFTITPAHAAKRGEYGALFWLNAGESGNTSNRKYPDVPTDCFYADGFEGQAVWIIPSKELVVVRLSLQQGNPLDENKFLKNIIAALPQ